MPGGTGLLVTRMRVLGNVYVHVIIFDMQLFGDDLVSPPFPARFVLPNHMLFQISEILPREPQGVLACCNPIPTLLRQQLNEVYLLVQQARETPPSDKV